jgi:copper chaperone CopZ
MWAYAVTNPSLLSPPLKMKLTNTLAAFALLLPLFSLACQSTSSSDATTLAEFRNDREIGLPVFGMSCPKCANNITLQLEQLEGVVTIEVNMSQGFVTVQAEPGKVPTRAEMVESIEKAGFTVPPKKLNALEEEVSEPRVQKGPGSEG